MKANAVNLSATLVGVHFSPDAESVRAILEPGHAPAASIGTEEVTA